MGNRWRMWAGVLAVFICGLIIGGVGGEMWARHQAIKNFSKMRENRGAFLAEMAMGRLQKELDLNQVQIARIKPLLLDGFAQGHEQFQEVRKKVNIILEKTVGRISPYLTKDQCEKLGEDQGLRFLLPPPEPGRLPGGKP